MLGLGSSLVTGGPSEKVLATFTSDFTSGTDSFVASSIDEGDLNLTTNQTIDGTGGWLKGTFTETQTSNFILFRRLNIPLSYSVGDTFEMSYKFYVVDDSNKWGSSPPIRHMVTLNNTSGVTYVDVPYDTTTSQSFTKSITGSSSTVNISFDFTQEKPSADAVFYVKDIELKVIGMG